MANEITQRSDPRHTARSLRASAQQPVATMAEAQAIMAQCETLRRPVDRRWLMGRIATLLSHFYVSPMSETEARAVAQDWANALTEFPQWAVEEACDEWLRTMDRRPTIAGIRKLCLHHFAVVEFSQRKAMAGPDGPSADRGTVTSAHRAQMAEAGERVVKALRSKGGRDD